MPNGLILKEISVGTFTMGSNTLMGSPAQQSAAPEHQVTLFDLGYIAIKTEKKRRLFVIYSLLQRKQTPSMR